MNPADETAFNARMRAFYAATDAAIAAHRPVCINRGACCKFGQFGHKLYVTQPELMYFRAGQQPAGLRPVESEDACPYQVAGQCTAREHRPLGCRVFFCDPAAKAWQPDVYEQGLAELKRIGAEFQIPYQYGEWLGMLREADSAGHHGVENEARKP